MPRMSGDEALKQLRTPLELKMIRCTGHLADNDIAKKADAVLVKPIKQEHSIRILRQIPDGPT